MNALAIPSSEIVDLAAYAPVTEAAEKLQKHPDHLSRECRNKLAAEGFAVIGKPADGGRPAWFILRKYDSRLLPDSQQAAFKAPGLLCFTERQRNDALARKYCVDRYRTGRRDLRLSSADVAAKVMADAKRIWPDLDISFASLQRWHRLYATPSDLVKLIDRRGGDQRHDASPEAWEALKGIYCDQRQPSIHQAWQIVQGLAEDNSWNWCSYDSCLRNLDRFIPPSVQTFHRQPAKYRSGLAPYIAQDPESWAAGENYISDHKALDLLVRYGEGFVRPWLTSWMDWRTRKICGWVLSDCPNSDTILAALHNAIVDESNMGGPSHVTIDNGRDYSSYVFNGTTKRERLGKINVKLDAEKVAGVFNLLRIEPHFCIAYSPNGKSRLERWHRSLERFCKHFPTYTGWNAQTKPETLNEFLKEPSKVPTFKEVQDRLGDFIKGDGLRTDHAITDLAEDGHTLSPSEAFAKWCPTRRVLADPAALDLIMAKWSKPVYVHRNGIAITRDGTPAHYGQYSTELMPFKGLSKHDRRPVRVTYDPADMNTIRVFDENYKFICVAEMNGVGGDSCRIDASLFKEQARKKSAYRKAQKVIANRSLDEILSNEELLSLEAGKRAQESAAAAKAAIPSLHIVDTPLDGQPRELHRQEVKTAFGTKPAVRKLGPLLPAPPARPRPSLVLHRNPEEEMRRLAHAVNQ